MTASKPLIAIACLMTAAARALPVVPQCRADTTHEGVLP